MNGELRRNKYSFATILVGFNIISDKFHSYIIMITFIVLEFAQSVKCQCI